MNHSISVGFSFTCKTLFSHRIVLDAGLKSYATRSESLQITACTIVALLISSIALRYIAHICLRFAKDVMLHCVCNPIVTILS